MAASQKPINSSAFGASVPAAAWKTIPSWYMVAQEDKAINPDLERVRSHTDFTLGISIS
jgi:hypothetical protein